MNFQQVVDGISAMTCVVSVEKRANGGYGDIRIVTGNKAYIDSIEHPMSGVQMLKTQFIPGSLYTNYMTRDLECVSKVRDVQFRAYQAAFQGDFPKAYWH